MNRNAPQIDRRAWLRRALAGMVGLAVLPVCAIARADDWTFRVRFTPASHAEPFSGRVYVFFSAFDEPRSGPDWFHPEPILARDVAGMKAGDVEELRLGGNAISFPRALAAESLAGMQAQAVIRFNPWERVVGSGDGNGLSAVVRLPAQPGPVELVVDCLIHEPPLMDNDWCRLLRVRSALLSAFHHRDVFLQAAVNLPPSYGTDPDRRYPVIFEVPGFGATMPQVWSKSPFQAESDGGVEFLHVTLDGNCPLGHHEFADSANNGPYSRALVEEFLPEFERQYRTIARPHARFLTGHSSGGWSSLWLQIQHPDVFGGTWSTAPDPVDFRDFQRVDLTASGQNLFHDSKGQRRPIARIGDQPVIWYDTFSQLEEALGPGGQLASFDAVFSARGDDGQPVPMFDRKTGDVDPAVVQSWEQYDIRRLLEQNWPQLGPQLSGKIHVFMGSLDTFYLDGATVLLKQALEQLGSDAVVEIHPGKDHQTLMTRELKSRITREMSHAFLRGEQSKSSQN